MSKGVQIAIGAGCIALLLGWYGATQISEGAFEYYQTLGEFRSASVAGKPSRVHGYVVPGSIERDVSGRQVRFQVQNDPAHAGGPAGELLPVVYASLEVPDLFKDGAEVVVEGQLPAQDVAFQATNLLAKCPSKFEGVSEDSAAL
jgi:cytochrome c-type biogenesis protein CcmE